MSPSWAMAALRIEQPSGEADTGADRASGLSPARPLRRGFCRGLVDPKRNSCLRRVDRQSDRCFAKLVIKRCGVVAADLGLVNKPDGGPIKDADHSLTNPGATRANLTFFAATLRVAFGEEQVVEL